MGGLYGAALVASQVLSRDEGYGKPAEAFGLCRGDTLTQAFWRGGNGYPDQGWTRNVPIINGVVQWTLAMPWQGPISPAGLPGSGSMQSQGDYVLGNTLYQNFWRGGQGWRRTVPIVNGTVQWNSASAWSSTLSIGMLFGGGGDYTASVSSESAGTNSGGGALPEGSYRFTVQQDAVPYGSGGVNHCTTPGCASATITVPLRTQTTRVSHSYDPLQRLQGATYTGGYSGTC